MKTLNIVQFLLIFCIMVLLVIFASNIELKRGCLPEEPCFGPPGYFYTIFNYELNLQIPHFAIGLFIGAILSALLKFFKKIDILTMGLLSVFLFLLVSISLILLFPIWVIY